MARCQVFWYFTDSTFPTAFVLHTLLYYYAVSSVHSAVQCGWKFLYFFFLVISRKCAWNALVQSNNSPLELMYSIIHGVDFWVDLWLISGSRESSPNIWIFSLNMQPYNRIMTTCNEVLWYFKHPMKYYRFITIHCCSGSIVYQACAIQPWDLEMQWDPECQKEW